MSDLPSSRERWLRLEALFHGALERGGEERSAYLERAAGDDPELRAELAAMLTAHDSQTGLALERRLLSDGPAAPFAPLVPGTRIGPYALVRLLGRGGMGDVYLAERADGEYQQRVALKLMRAGFEDGALAARFRLERQVLARLEHPGIARLLDGGLTADRHPFLVMEHVEGLPITDFCDGRSLSLEARLRLFLGVCGALQYAHQNLVVHRDLKPSNLLVTARGEIKLLDFGIAKLLAEEAASAGLTAAGGSTHPLTPEFASPEQVRGEAVSTASDVYALGLLLYELLTGVRAQPMANTSPDAIVEGVCRREAPRASEAVVAGEGAAVRAARRGEGSSVRLSRRLAGDLDTIVATAIRKDIRLRYPSAEALADDLERFLDGQPVRARAGTLAYRTGKFLRRHRLGVAAAVIAALALLGGLTMALLGAERARRAEARAREEAEVARQAVDFLVNLFRVSNPVEAKAGTVTARELLDEGAARIGSTLEDQPAVRARLLNVMGRAYRGLGLYEPAQGLLEQQVETLRRSPSPRAADLARALTSLSSLYESKGDYARSRELAGEAVDLLEGAAEPDPLALSDGLTQLVTAHSALGDLAEARRIGVRILALREGALGPGHQAVAGTLNNLAILHWQAGEPAAARPLLERALAIYERTRGREHLSVANLLNNLALIDEQLRQPELARGHHERALAIRRKTLAADHPDIAESLNNLGKLLNDLEQPSEARAALEEALAIRQSRLGPEHPLTATTLLNLAVAASRAGDPARGRELLASARAVFLHQLGAEHPFVAHADHALASLELAAGDLAAAEAAARRSLALREKVLGAEHADTRYSRDLLARVLRERGGSDGAAPPEPRP